MTPKLDRIPYFDERSRAFSVSNIIRKVPIRKKRVWTPRDYPLDQGAEGACVGFAWAGELASTPVKYMVDNQFARGLYGKAQAEDRAMGNNWPEGASILAGAKAAKNAGLISRYHWAFGIEQVIDTIVAKGPVVLGIWWYDSMYETYENGKVKVSGQRVGGHAIMAHGYWPNHPGFGEDVIMWTNSWGTGYGRNGIGAIRVTDLDKLLQDNGEACVPTDIRRK